MKPESKHTLEGESVLACRGHSPWRVNELFILELGRTKTFPKGAFKRTEEVMRKYDVLVVGLTHSRGVNRVMPIEFYKKKTLEGVSNLM